MLSVSDDDVMVHIRPGDYISIYLTHVQKQSLHIAHQNITLPEKSTMTDHYDDLLDAIAFIDSEPRDMAIEYNARLMREWKLNVPTPPGTPMIDFFKDQKFYTRAYVLTQIG